MNLLESPYVISAQVLQHPLATPGEYVAAAIVLAIVAGGYFLMPVLIDLRESIVERRKKLAKKQALKDLIVMKEIQTEIDEEMHQAMLRSALREKAAS